MSTVIITTRNGSFGVPMADATAFLDGIVNHHRANADSAIDLADRVSRSFAGITMFGAFGPDGILTTVRPVAHDDDDLSPWGLVAF